MLSLYEEYDGIVITGGSGPTQVPTMVPIGLDRLDSGVHEGEPLSADLTYMYLPQRKTAGRQREKEAHAF